MATLLLCRPGFEAALQDELRAKPAQCRVEGAMASGPGWLRAPGPVSGPPLIFERQRLPEARPLSGDSRRALARAALALLLDEAAAGPPGTWTLYACAAHPAAPGSLAARAAGVAEALLEEAGRAAPELMAHYLPPEEAGAGQAARVLQLVLTEAGAWGALTPWERLSDSHPGGVHRMRQDPAAPSRSYLKVEEALERLGEPPRAGQRVIDLGAAPGGWTYAFVRRGCRVLAVDRGPLRLRRDGEGAGSWTHVRADGLRYRPEADWMPVDWLVSDMLVPPGVTLGLLRKWVERGWMQRFIVNVKIPQHDPYVALAPLERYLHERLGWGAHLRQLYHDRREVTAWGRVPGAAGGGVRAPAGPARRSRGRRRRR